MALINSDEPEVLKSSTVKCSTPDGSMFFTIVENNGKPIGVDIVIGKAGSSIQAWAQAISKLITVALRNNIELSAIAEELSGITSDKLSFSGERAVRSVPDAITQAILLYLSSKHPALELRRRRRGPSVFGEEVE